MYGRFSFLNLIYERELAVADSAVFKQLSQRLAVEIERELYSFSLPGRFEVAIESFLNRSVSYLGCDMIVLSRCIQCDTIISS